MAANLTDLETILKSLQVSFISKEKFMDFRLFVNFSSGNPHSIDFHENEKIIWEKEWLPKHIIIEIYSYT